MRASAGLGMVWLVALFLVMAVFTEAAAHSILQMGDRSVLLAEATLIADASAPGTQTFGDGSSRMKSIPKAFLLSLLVPGTGQFYAQAPRRGRFFVGAEAAIWAGYLGFQLHSNWKEEDYKLYAAEHAGVDPGGKSKGYFEDVSLFMSMEEYNRRQLRNFREDAELYSQGDFWEWDSDRSRRKFDSLYRASTNAEHNAVIMTGIGLLNHFLSAVDAARTAKAFNKTQASRSSPVQFTFRVRPAPGSSMVMVGLKKRF